VAADSSTRMPHPLWCLAVSAASMQACISSCGHALLPLNLQGAHAAAASLSLSVSIQGLGPRFRLLINLANEGTELATDLQVGGQEVQAGGHGLRRWL
jgi:hypothetical protein